MSKREHWEPRRFSYSEVRAAADLSNSQAKSWLHRKAAHLVPLLVTEGRPGVTPDQSSTLHNSYSWNRLIQVVIMAKLVRQGWQPKPAAEAALQFSDFGEGASARSDEARLSRYPAELFPDGRTFLVAHAGPPVRAKVVYVPGGADFYWTWLGFLAALRAEERPTDAAVLDMNAIITRVRQVLGLPT